ncbi:phosphatase PAP2 family protein [Streptomyces sp. BRA346]|uniref:phosphatase PAP2 family protein n=1 Tax=Streptomyces sp. BRA346 TaxID=2878199 RepID=UPI004063A53D
MPTHSHHTARLLGPAALLAAGAAAIVLLSPGGLGDPGPVEVGHGASASAYRALTGAVADAPMAPLEAASEGTVAVLGLLLAVLGWTALRRKDARGIAGTTVVGLGTVAAYALSEALKLVVDEERPCRAVRGAAAIAHCPAAGDWSFPSNHATLAAPQAQHAQPGPHGRPRRHQPTPRNRHHRPDATEPGARRTLPKVHLWAG